MIDHNFFLWTMSVGDVASEGMSPSVVQNWSEFKISLAKRDLIEKIEIVEFDQDLDDGRIMTILKLHYHVKGNNWAISVVLHDQTDLVNAFITFDQNQVSQENVQQYFFS